MSHADDYLRLSHQLLRRRWKDGPLPDEDEADAAERLDDIWSQMTVPERDAFERWSRANRLHGVVFRELGQWICRLLGHDFTGVSPVRRGAIANLLYAAEHEIARAHREGKLPFDGDRPPEGDFIDFAVARIINPTRKHQQDELLLVEAEGAAEKWTLYIADIE